MARKYFGTDGIRGTANSFPMTPEMALHIAMASGSLFAKEDRKHTVVIGKDTRLSGYMIEPALAAGFVSVGIDVVMLGPMPTPAVAMLTRSLRADLGVMISASHNPYHDNGIKFFNPTGQKLSDEMEEIIEKRIDGGLDQFLVSPDKLGRAKRLEGAPERYIEFVKNTFPKGKRLTGKKIVVDAANGASYHIAKRVFWELGAEVVAIATEPDGFNINENCGATHPEQLQKAVKKHKADIGIAFDGDADRIVCVDEHAHVVDGDQLLAVLAVEHQKQGVLKGNTLVATQMSNLGLELFLASKGISLIRTQVGDRYVAEAMREGGFNLGGEQSGHIILSDYNTTGDALISALQLLSILMESKKPASSVLNAFEPLPQVLKNVKVKKGADPLKKSNVKNSIKKAEKELGDSGRILVRKSGTEPIVRVMAEGTDPNQINDVVDAIITDIDECA